MLNMYILEHKYTYDKTVQSPPNKPTSIPVSNHFLSFQYPFRTISIPSFIAPGARCMASGGRMCKGGPLTTQVIN